MVKWFLLENDEVRGPFSEEQIQAQLDAQIISDECLVWTKGMRHWKNVSNWSTELKGQALTPAQVQQTRLWHFAVDNEPRGPLPYAAMIQELSQLGDQAGQALLWTKGMKSWAPIFDFHEVMDELNINRRQNPRAPIQGQVIIPLGQKQIIGSLKSISQGGFGADRLEGLLPGQSVMVEIRSPAFFEPLHVKAEVRYVRTSGYVGFCFTGMAREATATVIQYVKGQTKSGRAAAA